MFKKYTYIGLIIISFLVLSGCNEKAETIEQATDKEAGMRLTAKECINIGKQDIFLKILFTKIFLNL